MSDSPSSTHEPNPPVSTPVALLAIVVVTIAAVAVVGYVVFDLSEDEGVVPQVEWSLTNGDQPTLHHQGGDDIDCALLTVEGDLGSGETLCTYFDGEITEGDSAALMDTGSEDGTIVLMWYDVETEVYSPLQQWSYPLEEQD